jgi:hypothetical protein
MRNAKPVHDFLFACSHARDDPTDSDSRLTSRPSDKRPLAQVSDTALQRNYSRQLAARMRLFASFDGVCAAVPK